jgi:hypothetical protein
VSISARLAGLQQSDIETEMAMRGQRFYEALLAGPVDAAAVHLTPVFAPTARAALTNLLRDFYGWLMECQDSPEDALVVYAVGPQAARERLVDDYQRHRVEVDYQNGLFND